jgi:hypothetical protein
MAALDRGGTLAIAGIYLTDIPHMSYDKYLFQERQLRSVTSNTRQDAREFLAFAAVPKLSGTTHEYPLDAADRAPGRPQGRPLRRRRRPHPLTPKRPALRLGFRRWWIVVHAIVCTTIHHHIFPGCASPICPDRMADTARFGRFRRPHSPSAANRRGRR